MVAVFLTAPCPASAQNRRPLDVVLALDNSGSMKQNDPAGLMRTSAADFARRLPRDSSAGIVVFDRTAMVALPLTPVAEAQFEARLDQALEHVTYRGPLTDIPGGVERALYELREHGRTGARKALVLFTDGFVDVGDAQRNRSRSNWLLSDLVEQARRDQVPVFGIAFTEQADFELIQSLAQKTGGQHFRLLDSSHFRDVFAQVSDRIERVISTPVQVTNNVLASAPTSVARSAYPIASILLVTVGVFALCLVGRAAYVRFDALALPATLQDSLDPTRVYSIERRVYRIGSVRHVGFRRNDLVIPIETISRAHATIRYRNGGFHIEDDGSRNDTFVDGVRIKSRQSRLINPGSLLRFDAREFRFGLAAGVTKPRRANVSTSLAADDAPASPLSRDTIPPRDSGSVRPRVDTQPPPGNDRASDGDRRRAGPDTDNQCLDCDRQVNPTQITLWHSFRVCRECEAALQAISTNEATAKRHSLAVKQQRRRPTVGTT